MDRRDHQHVVVELRPTPPQHRPPSTAPTRRPLPRHHHPHHRQAPHPPRPLEPEVGTYPLKSLGNWGDGDSLHHGYLPALPTPLKFSLSSRARERRSNSPCVSRLLLDAHVDSAGAPTRAQQSNTDQQMSFRNRWSSSTSSRIASGNWSRCHWHSSRPARSLSPSGAAARAALIA